MATRTDPTFVDPTGDISPGERLRKAREAADLSVRDIATALRLEPRTIEALESGSFDELPAPTFVRGYLRGYARAVGLPPDPLLDLYERHGFSPPAIIPDPVEKSQAHTSDLVFRLATFAIGGVLLVLVVLWWNSQDLGVSGIGGDLLNWSADTAQDSSLPDTQQAAAPPDSDEADTSSSFFGDLFSEPDETATGTRTEATPTMQEPVTEADTAAEAGAASETDGTTETGSAADTGAVPETERTAGADAPSEPDGAAEADLSTETQPVTETAGAADAGAETETPADTAATTVSEPGTGSGAVATPLPAGETRIAEVAGTAEPPAEQPSTETDSPAESGTDGVAESDDTISPEDTTASDVAAASDEAAVPGGESDAATDPSTETTASAEESDSAGESDDATEPSDAQPDESDSTAAQPDEDTAGGEPASVPAPPGESNVVLEFAHESWVEVYDRDRTRLFFGLVAPDRVLRFTGLAPFDVLLGFALDARITLDGKEFDHTPFINHGVARFRLDRAGDGTSRASTQEQTNRSGPPVPTDETRGP